MKLDIDLCLGSSEKVEVPFSEEFLQDPHDNEADWVSSQDNKRTKNLNYWKIGKSARRTSKMKKNNKKNRMNDL